MDFCVTHAPAVRWSVLHLRAQFCKYRSKHTFRKIKLRFWLLTDLKLSVEVEVAHWNRSKNRAHTCVDVRNSTSYRSIVYIALFESEMHKTFPCFKHIMARNIVRVSEGDLEWSIAVILTMARMHHHESWFKIWYAHLTLCSNDYNCILFHAQNSHASSDAFLYEQSPHQDGT